jgi:hypothetical protein
MWWAEAYVVRANFRAEEFVVDDHVVGDAGYIGGDGRVVVAVLSDCRSHQLLLPTDNAGSASGEVKA